MYVSRISNRVVLITTYGPGTFVLSNHMYMCQLPEL